MSDHIRLNVIPLRGDKGLKKPVPYASATACDIYYLPRRELKR